MSDKKGRALKKQGLSLEGVSSWHLLKFSEYPWQEINILSKVCGFNTDESELPKRFSNYNPVLSVRCDRHLSTVSRHCSCIYMTALTLGLFSKKTW